MSFFESNVDSDQMGSEEAIKIHTVLLQLHVHAYSSITQANTQIKIVDEFSSQILSMTRVNLSK